jgi:hypothetical protein
VALCGFALAAGCASAPHPPEPPPQLPRAGGALRVQLVFGADADLDLYVTDPLQETVYFGNSPSSVTGGRLDADRRCDAPAPRIETVAFASARPGHYRVGVDHAAACGRRDETVFLLVVDGPGLHRQSRGEISRASFLPRVLEFELSPEAP